jgi:hypothetical protein
MKKLSANDMEIEEEDEDEEVQELEEDIQMLEL